MVEFVRAAPNLSKQFQADIGRSMGEGLSNFLTNYLAGKAVDDATTSNEFKNAPLDQQLSILEQKTRPFGDVGQNLMQRRGQIALQQQQQLQQQKELDRQKKISPIIQKIQSGQAPTEQELQLFTPQEMLSLAKMQSQQNIANIRSQNKAPPGGLSGQPVPSEISDRMNQVLQENPGANADQLTIAMDKAGVPRSYSNSLIESRRQETKPIFEPTEQKLEAERVSKIADEVSRDYQSAQAEDLRLDRMQKLSEKGNLSTPLMMKTLETLGLPLGVLGNPETEEYSKLESDFVRDVSKVFPGQIRVFEIQAYLRTIPSLMNSEEGRKSIIRNRKLLNEAKKVKYDEYKNILKENNGKKPRNLDLLLEERTAPKLNEIGEKFREGVDNSLEKQLPKMKMYDNNGKSYEIPSHLIPQAQKQGLIFK